MTFLNDMTFEVKLQLMKKARLYNDIIHAKFRQDQILDKKKYEIKS